MATSNLSDPFVLASYTLSTRGKSPQRHAPGIYAASYKKTNTSDGFVTVAAQADGLYIVDVSTLHPIVSHTLGPSTSFACPPLTLPSSSSHASSTYAVISASPQLSSLEDAGRAIWMWQDDFKDARQKVKQSKILFSTNQTVYGLYSCSALTRRILAVSTIGDVSVLDSESLDVKSTSTGSASSIIDAYVFSSNAATFVNEESGAILILCLSGKSKTMHLRMLAIDEADLISEKQEWELPIDTMKVASISCSSAGILSVLSLDGTLSSFVLSSQEPAQLSSPLHLSGLSFISTASKFPVSTLALTSSHILLAAVASQEVTLLLWDVQFSVLLASHTLSIPSALSASALHVRLVPGTQNQTKAQDRVLGQAFLILSSDSTENKTTSVLLALPYSVPTVSTISAAMGKGGAGKRWLRVSEEQAQLLVNGKATQTPEELARVNLLVTMRSAMQAGRPQVAVAAFMKWAPKSDSTSPVTLDYNFVKELLSILLLLPVVDSKTTTAASPYAPDVTQYILEKRVVSSAMVPTPGGLLGALRARDDWNSIELAFRTVLDLAESEIIECLRVVVAQNRLAAAASDEAMDVDRPSPSKAVASTSVTSLPVFLNLVATYPTSHGPLLLAFRRYMQDAEELTIILQVLNGWLTRKAMVDEHLMPTPKDLKKTEQGIWVVTGRKGDKNKKQKEMPSLEKIVELLQTILDASFLTLLQHPSSHKILRSLNAQLSPEIEFADATESLRGLLEPFAIAQEKAVKESLIPQQEREREKQKGDWRQRRKGPGAAPGVAADIGVYQLEELVL